MQQQTLSWTMNKPQRCEFRREGRMWGKMT